MVGERLTNPALGTLLLKPRFCCKIRLVPVGERIRNQATAHPHMRRGTGKATMISVEQGNITKNFMLEHGLYTYSKVEIQDSE